MGGVKPLDCLPACCAPFSAASPSAPIATNIDYQPSVVEMLSGGALSVVSCAVGKPTHPSSVAACQLSSLRKSLDDDAGGGPQVRRRWRAGELAAAWASSWFAQGFVVSSPRFGHLGFTLLDECVAVLCVVSRGTVRCAALPCSNAQVWYTHVTRNEVKTGQRSQQE